jgi:hypothetical protein
MMSIEQNKIGDRPLNNNSSQQLNSTKVNPQAVLDIAKKMYAYKIELKKQLL